MEHPLSQFKYCPKCGSEHFNIHNEKSKQCTNCGFVYYFNPSSATVALILNKKNELLVCRRAKDPAKGTLDLGMIKQVYPLGDMELNGTINADMQMSGRLSYIEKEQYDNMKASGTIGLTNMKLKMQDMPDVDIKKSLFTFTPKYLQLSETTVNIGKTCFCCSIIIRRNFFFGCLIRRYEFDFAFIHAGYFANSNLKEKLILLIKKVY